MKNYLVRGIYMGNRVYWTWVEFNKTLNSNVYEWTYGYVEDKSFYTKEEAERHLENLKFNEKSKTDLEIVQL